MHRTRPLFAAALPLAGLLLAGSPAAAAPGRAAPRPAPKAKTAARARKPAVRTPALPAWVKQVASLDIAPASATLDGPRATQHLLVSATLKDGTVYDATDLASFQVTDPKRARIAGAVLQPLADGETRVTARLGRVVSPPAGISMKNVQAPGGVEFVNDVMPVLAKAGCNATACHGSPVGKGGFKLSLFGYEPELDHPAIVKDADGRRIDRKSPDKSLLLLKSTMGVPHAGGLRFKKESPEYRLLLAWIREGAPGLGEFEARVRQVSVIPEQPWIPAPGARQHLAVTAYMSDGTTRDVTDKVLFSSNDDAIAAVDEAGLVTAKRPGETAVMVRFMGQVGVARVAVLPPWKLPAGPRPEARGYIDTLVQAKLAKLRMLPSDLCTDEEFIRRATLDTCGIIPTADEVRRFVNDRAADKRALLIDRLLERSEFVDLWTMKWNDTLRNNPRLSRQGLAFYADWIREQVAKNRPYDLFVRDLLTASGKTADLTLDVNNLPRQLQNRPNAARLVEQLNREPFNAASNYYAISRDPLDVTSATSQVFLGVRIECARCHNHPFEKWTQSDYYALAAYFDGIQVRGQNQTPVVVSMSPRASNLRHPKTNEVVEPKPLDNADLKIERGMDRRAVVADWIVSPNNPFFARAAANRLWGHYFGRGIVEPIDDFRVTNPPSNPELLDALAKELVERKFDLKALHRTILNSRTYQQSSRPNQWNRTDTSNFARFYPRRLMAEQLYDSISQATGIFLQPAGGRPGRRPLPPGLAGNLGRALAGALPNGDTQRVMQLPALPLRGGGGGGRAGELGAFLETFGKPRREVVCECERSADGNMGQALMLINGAEVNQKITAPLGRVRTLGRQNVSEPQAIEELYLAALSRRPTPVEAQEAYALIRTAGARAEGYEDLMWSLLNSREFLFNH